MHELSITQNILEIALRHAQAADATSIRAIYLVVGQYASLVDDSVQFYWDIISQDTMAQGARLYFDRRPASLLCRNCQQQYQPSAERLTCPICGGSDVQLVSGDEFYVQAIDVEAAGNEK